MEIKFTIEPDMNSDDYIEIFTADIFFDDGTSLSISASEEDTSYEGFRADIFEDLFTSLYETTGNALVVEEDDYTVFDDEDIDVIIDDYLENLDDNNGC